MYSLKKKKNINKPHEIRLNYFLYAQRPKNTYHVNTPLGGKNDFTKSSNTVLGDEKCMCIDFVWLE